LAASRAATILAHWGQVCGVQLIFCRSVSASSSTHSGAVREISSIRGAVSDFLYNEWRNGALLGGKPEEAFFVRCDRSTMTQNDLDNGRLICEIGVAVLKPAEFTSLTALLFAVLALALYFLVRYLRRVTPRPDHPLALRADAYTDKPTDAQMTAARVVWLERIFDRDLFEKVVLLSLLLIIFSNIIPTIDTRPLTITLQVLVLLVYNTSVSHLLARRGTTIASGIVHLAVMWLGNFAFIFLASFLPGVRVNLFNAVFIVTLLSLLVTLYDRYRVFHLARFERKALFGRAPAAP